MPVGQNIKRHRLVADKAREGSVTVLIAYGHYLETAYSFKHLGRILYSSYGDWKSVVQNLKKFQKKWAQMYRVLGREGTDAWT